MYHKGAIENAPLQVYVSALVFSPRHSLIRNLFKEEAPPWLTIRPAMIDKWGACLQTLEGHSGSVNSVAFSHDSTRLASASDDSTVKIWDASSGDCLQTLEGHSSFVTSVAFSHDSTRLASASGDSTAKIWDASSGDCLQTLDIRRPLYNISFDATGSCLHTKIGAIVISASATSNNTTSVTKPQHPQYQHIALSPDSTWIIYHSKKLVWLPSEYRPFRSAISGKTIGIGVGTGKVWIYSIELDEP